MDNPRTDTARRHDDSETIESAQEAPSQGGRSGGNLQRDIATRDEESRATGDKEGVTRVRGSDKPEETDLPRYNQR